jgi:Cdc6-like AAA superfamily ATPase
MRGMDIASYLSKSKYFLEERTNSIKDFAVFDYNYIPNEPVMREEVKEVIKNMLRFEMSGIPTHMTVIGSRGSGKTLMFKYLQKLISKETKLDVLYVNCRHRNTSFKIFAHLLGDENVAGSSLVNLYQRFMLKYKKKTLAMTHFHGGFSKTVAEPR